MVYNTISELIAPAIGGEAGDTFALEVSLIVDALKKGPFWYTHKTETAEALRRLKFLLKQNPELFTHELVQAWLVEVDERAQRAGFHGLDHGSGLAIDPLDTNILVSPADMVFEIQGGAQKGQLRPLTNFRISFQDVTLRVLEDEFYWQQSNTIPLQDALATVRVLLRENPEVFLHQLAQTWLQQVEDKAAECGLSVEAER